MQECDVRRRALGGTEDGDLYLDFFVILVAHLRRVNDAYPMKLYILK